MEIRDTVGFQCICCVLFLNIHKFLLKKAEYDGVSDEEEGPSVTMAPLTHSKPPATGLPTPGLSSAPAAAPTSVARPQLGIYMKLNGGLFSFLFISHYMQFFCSIKLKLIYLMLGVSLF